MNSLSLKAKLATSITAIILLVISLGGVVFYSLQKGEGDTEIVSAAGRQRMLSQAMSKSVLSYSLAKDSLQAAKSQVSELDRYITNMRGTYTATVIGTAKQAGIGISMHPEKALDPAVPFPATFTRMVGEKFAAEGRFSVDILAEDPVNLEQGLKDAIDKEAFQALQANPEQIFFKEVESGGRLYLRYYTADKAVVEACASCHTKLKGRAFKVGDMLGIRRFSMLFADNVALGRVRLDPSLKEYQTALVVFSKTLAAFKSGGDYPADLSMTKSKPYLGTTNPKIQAKILKIEAALKTFTVAVDQLTQSQIGSSAYWEAQQAVPTSANKVRKLSNDLTVQFTDIANANEMSVRWAVGVMVLVIIIAFIGLFLMINRTVLSPVTRIIQAARVISNGDLTQQINSGRKDEIGILSKTLDEMSQNLNGMITKIFDASQAIFVASGNISRATRLVTDGATEQSQQTQVAAVSANEMKVVSQDISHNTTEAADAASQATQVAIDGGKVVEQSNEGMARISSSVLESTSSVEQLAKYSDQIGQIVAVIDDIANQTNLLALNAAIEAARAGDHGRGFAVVADEVRHLAIRTSDATKEIAEMIRSIQNGTTVAVQSMHEGGIEVKAGSELVAKTGQSLQQIVEVVEGLTDRIQQIATATQEQSASMEGVTHIITTVSEAAQTANEQAQLSSQSCDEVASLADELQRMMKDFKL